MWAMAGHKTGEILSYGGRMVVHPVRHELEWLIGDTARVVQLCGDNPEEVSAIYGRPAMLFKDHPDNSNVRWPLDRRDFL
jgi:hypothetical protein